MNDIMIAEVENLENMLENEIDEIISTVFENDLMLIEYLRAASVCQGFSVNNIVLIYKQNPAVKKLYSIKSLKESGISLKNDCKPIHIVVPMCKSVKYDSDDEGRRLLMRNVADVYDTDSTDSIEEPFFKKDLHYVYEIFNNLYATAEIKTRYGGRETIEQMKEKSRIIFVNVSDDLEHKVIDWLYGYFYIKINYMLKHNKIKKKYEDCNEYFNFLVSCCVTSVMQGLGYDYDRLYNIFNIYKKEDPNKNVLIDIQNLIRMFWSDFIKYENAYNMLFTKDESAILFQMMSKPDRKRILNMIKEFYENTEIEEYKEVLSSLKEKISIVDDDTIKIIYQDNKQGKLSVVNDYGIEYA